MRPCEQYGFSTHCVENLKKVFVKLHKLIQIGFGKTCLIDLTIISAWAHEYIFVGR